MSAVWTIQWEELTIEAYEQESRYVKIEARNADHQLVWEYLVDATGGERDLLPRTWIWQEPSATQPFLTVAVDAEHCKSGDGFGQEEIRLDKQGRRLTEG